MGLERTMQVGYLPIDGPQKEIQRRKGLGNDAFPEGSALNPNPAKKGFIMQSHVPLKENLEPRLEFDPDDAAIMREIQNK